MKKEKSSVRKDRFLRFSFLEKLEDLLFPEPNKCLCCEQLLTSSEHLGVCPTCIKSLTELYSFRQTENDHKQIPGIASCFSAFPYTGPARELILELKFHSNRRAALPLVQWMSLASCDGQVLVPVPTTRERKRQRGFNQAQVLAAELGKTWHLPVLEALQRIEARQSQYKLSAEERKNNLKGTVKASNTVRGKSVILVDDVCTTGATAQECARALLEAGAENVCLVTAAATELNAESQSIFPNP